MSTKPPLASSADEVREAPRKPRRPAAVKLRPSPLGHDAQQAAFDTLALRIVTGAYPPGSNLPAERELAAELGTSRATLREALRRLTEWHLVAARRGSGVVVRDLAAEATLELLPLYLRTRTDPVELGKLITELLALRTGLVLEVLRLIAGRFRPCGLDGARAALERAHEARGDFARFTLLDFAVLHEVVRAAQFLPGVWLLNSVRGIYVELAGSLATPAAGLPPARYRAVYREVFALLEAGRGDEAAHALEKYFAQHDRRLRAALGLSGGK